MMEISPELLELVAGLLIMGLTQMAKRVKLPVKTTLAVLSVSVGVAYHFLFAPSEAETGVVQFVVTSFGYATIVYLWVVKYMNLRSA